MKLAALKPVYNGKYLWSCRKENRSNLPAKTETCFNRDIFPAPSDFVFADFTVLYSVKAVKIEPIINGILTVLNMKN